MTGGFQILFISINKVTKKTVLLLAFHHLCKCIWRHWTNEEKAALLPKKDEKNASKLAMGDIIEMVLSLSCYIFLNQLDIQKDKKYNYCTDHGENGH